MRKIWNFITHNKDIIGIIGHLTWLVTNIIIPDFTSKEEYLAGHGLIFTITGKGLWEKKKVDKNTLNKKL